MQKTYNFYCDESTHIKHDGKPYMIISYVSTPLHQLKLHNKAIRKLKLKHFYKGEMNFTGKIKT